MKPGTRERSAAEIYAAEMVKRYYLAAARYHDIQIERIQDGMGFHPYAAAEFQLIPLEVWQKRSEYLKKRAQEITLLDNETIDDILDGLIIDECEKDCNCLDYLDSTSQDDYIWRIRKTHSIIRPDNPTKRAVINLKAYRERATSAVERARLEAEAIAALELLLATPLEDIPPPRVLCHEDVAKRITPIRGDSVPAVVHV